VGLATRARDGRGLAAPTFPLPGLRVGAPPAPHLHHHRMTAQARQEDGDKDGANNTGDVEAEDPRVPCSLGVGGATPTWW
jgi:hypothetical protein